jgi:predicted amidophosphoribosyltransferase
LRTRGYNQAELLARDFAHLSGRSLVNALARSVGSTQTTLQPVARGANVAGAFQVVPAHADDLRDAHVILVDDVLTTGATVIECARTLADSGVRCVTALTFARALDARRLVNT